MTDLLGIAFPNSSTTLPPPNTHLLAYVFSHERYFRLVLGNGTPSTSQEQGYAIADASTQQPLARLAPDRYANASLHNGCGAGGRIYQLLI